MSYIIVWIKGGMITGMNLCEDDSLYIYIMISKGIL